MSDQYRILVPVNDVIDLAAFGYAKGSEAHVILNPSKAFVAAWDGTFAQYKDGKEVRPDAGDEARYPLVPVIVRRIVLIGADGERHEYRFETADDVRDFDQNVDYRLLDAVIAEIWVRGREGVLNGRRSFRNSGQRGAEGAKPAGPAGADS